MPELSETLVLPDEEPTLELDELWSFVLKKANKRWIWIALCRQTRQVVAFVIGDRSQASCQKLWEKIPEAFRLGHCFSDFWEAYRLVIPPEQHHASGKESGETAQAFGSGGIIRFANGLPALSEKHCRFQRAMRCTRYVCFYSCIAITMNWLSPSIEPLPQFCDGGRRIRRFASFAGRR